LLIQLPSASFEMLMRYILDRDLDKPAFRRRIRTLHNPKLSKNAMSLAEQFRQEGRQEGLILSKQQDILEALEIRFQRIPEGLREEIDLITDTAKLQSMLRAAIRSATLEEFAEAL
jgi:predicted transposase YdaD